MSGKLKKDKPFLIEEMNRFFQNFYAPAVVLEQRIICAECVDNGLLNRDWRDGNALFFEIFEVSRVAV